jgi:hypothetical protein
MTDSLQSRAASFLTLAEIERTSMAEWEELRKGMWAGHPNSEAEREALNRASEAGSQRQDTDVVALISDLLAALEEARALLSEFDQAYYPCVRCGMGNGTHELRCEVGPHVEGIKASPPPSGQEAAR